MNRQSVSLAVNGQDHELELPPRQHLADALRENLGLTGTHLGCEQGVCGACTVMIDGAPQRACLNLAVSCGKAQVRTIEGFQDDALMAALRANFSAYHALQCGYCTPGMLITGYDIVRRLPDADHARIRQELAGNLCRCTGYAGIVEAIAATLQEFTRDHPWRTAVPDQPAAITIESTERIVVSQPPSQTSTPLPSNDSGISRSITIDMPPQELWALLGDIDTIAACLPGFTLTSSEQLADGQQRLVGLMTVSLGPIKTRFEGQADVSFDHSAMTGLVNGRGEDRRSRSAGSGNITFGVKPEGNGARFDVNVVYEVTGPLAQFSRNRLVEDLIATLLDQFAANVGALSRGGDVVASGELKAGSFGAQLLAKQWHSLRDKLSGLWQKRDT